MSYLPRLSKIIDRVQLTKKLTGHHYFVVTPANFSCPYTNRAIELLDDNGCTVIAMAVDHLRGNKEIPPYKIHPMLKSMSVGPVRGVPSESNMPHTYPRIICYDANKKEYQWIGGSEALQKHLNEKFSGILVNPDGNTGSCNSGCSD